MTTDYTTSTYDALDATGTAGTTDTIGADRGAAGLDAAMGAAKKAGDGGRIDDFIERLADRVGAKASVRAVFGDPIERGGITVIPVAKVRWGFGGGAGSAPVAMGPGRPDDDLSPFSDIGPAGSAAAAEDERPQGSGSGAGGGVTASPVGYLEIGPEGATFKPITSVMPSPGFVLAAGATTALVVRALAKLVRR
jgi:uncharacterized spore protein YtfJ